MPIWTKKLRLLKLFPSSISEVTPSLINQDVMIPRSKDGKTLFGLVAFANSDFILITNY